jgi:hypothetical protein
MMNKEPIAAPFIPLFGDRLKSAYSTKMFPLWNKNEKWEISYVLSGSFQKTE